VKLFWDKIHLIIP